MAIAAPTAETTDPIVTRWGTASPHVQRALAFINKRGAITAEELVEWDRTHGRRLFTWDDEQAASFARLHEARLFLNRWRGQFENMLLKKFTHVRKDEEADIETSAYFTSETISNHPGMRAQVIADIVKRGKRLASQLKFWKLSDAERDERAGALERGHGRLRLEGPSK